MDKTNSKAKKTDYQQPSVSLNNKDDNEFNAYIEANLDRVIKKIESLSKHVKHGGTLSELAGLSENDLESMYQMAYMLYQNGNYTQAKLAFTHLFSFNHHDKRFILGLASASYMLKQYEEALLSYTAAQQADKSDPSIHYYTGDCHFKLHQYEEAEECYQHAKSLLHETSTSTCNNEENSLLEAMLSKKIKIIQTIVDSETNGTSD